LKITADTNLLVRVAAQDDARQVRLAEDMLAAAELVALPLQALCEFVWVMSSGYRKSRGDIARTIRTMLAAKNIATDEPAVTAGLAALDSGGDFADGVIAFEGQRLGADSFLSFDRKAVAMLNASGISATLLV
jgi:predicted nucleic-acid-binding protein